eukprot:TRINITY_DN4198_c0_g1_i4.p1 TRINITY_DN4198_c0_g1~~TRINITY_DN4198_c0_g1_i4.p1  ORF type:complete len:219 (-),score=13.68 TRINITY_DN4198_c0_g1_i4:40-696(-)
MNTLADHDGALTSVRSHVEEDSQEWKNQDSQLKIGIDQLDSGNAVVPINPVFIHKTNEMTLIRMKFQDFGTMPRICAFCWIAALGILAITCLLAFVSRTDCHALWVYSSVLLLQEIYFIRCLLNFINGQLQMSKEGLASVVRWLKFLFILIIVNGILAFMYNKDCFDFSVIHSTINAVASAAFQGGMAFYFIWSGNSLIELLNLHERLSIELSNIPLS